jgi:hypothetical protein
MVHFDQQALTERMIKVTSPLNMDVVHRLLNQLAERSDTGQYWLGGFPIRWCDGYIQCIWKAAGTIPEAIEFAGRLHAETGCDVLDTK